MSADATLLRALGRWGDTTLASAGQLVGMQLIRPVQRGAITDRQRWVVVGLAWGDGGTVEWRLRSLEVRGAPAPEEQHHPSALADSGAYLHRCASTAGVVHCLAQIARARRPSVEAYDEQIRELAAALETEAG